MAKIVGIGQLPPTEPMATAPMRLFWDHGDECDVYLTTNPNPQAYLQCVDKHEVQRQGEWWGRATILVTFAALGAAWGVAQSLERWTRR